MLTAREHVGRYLKDSAAPLWWPGLAEKLVQESGLLSEGYSTSKWLASATPTRLWQVGSQGVVDLSLSVELLAALPAQQLSSKGERFADEFTIISHGLEGLGRALALLQQVPSLAATVGALVKSIHILEASDPGFDVSFSDPSIPFSVFLNISEGPFADIRTAEALVHEAMHLQLSLIERLTPIAKSDQSLHYSPWKRSERPVAGLMHALYVFRVIDQWLSNLPENSDAFTDYAEKRRKQIDEEVEQLNPSAFFDQLTVEGQRLLTLMLP